MTTSAALACCCKEVIFFTPCEPETPCATLPDEFYPPTRYSKVPTSPATMRVSGRVDDLTHGTQYDVRVYRDTGGLISHIVTVDNEDGEGPDQYVWQVAQQLADLVNADTFDVAITATATRDGTVYLDAGANPILARMFKTAPGGTDTMAEFAERWPTGSPGTGCMIIGGNGTFDDEVGGLIRRVSNFSGFSCWGATADTDEDAGDLLPPCTVVPFQSAISGKHVLVVDDKVYVWRAKVTNRVEGTMYAVAFASDPDPIFTYTVTGADAEGAITELAATIAAALDAALPSGYFAVARGPWVEVRSDTGHRRFGNMNNTFAIRAFGYQAALDSWYIFPTRYYGVIMTGWDLIPVTGTQTVQLIDTQLGVEEFTHTVGSGTDEAEALAYANAFNAWVSGTPEHKGFRQVQAERVYWGVQHTGTVPTASGSATALYLDSGASADDDYYNDCRVVIDSGTGAGQIQTITDYAVAGPTKLATVSPGWSTNPDTSSVFRIYRNVGVAFESANADHHADLRGEVPDVGIHEDRHDQDLFWAVNGNTTADELPMGWSDVGVVRKCCGPQDGAVYAVRFVGTDPVTPFTAYDVTASVTVDNPNTTGDCKGDGPDSTAALVAEKWVTEFNSVASGIPANVRPTATHIGSGRITLEGAVYGTDPESAGAFNFGDAGLTAWMGGSVQSPVNGYEEPGAWWYYDGSLTEIPYIPFVGWAYGGDPTTWHAANIDEATIIGSEYAGDTECPAPETGDCPAICCGKCYAPDVSWYATGTVDWGGGVTAAFDTRTPSTGSTPGTEITVEVLGGCGEFQTLRVTRTETIDASPDPPVLVRQDFATFGWDLDLEVQPGEVVDCAFVPNGAAGFTVDATAVWNPGTTTWHIGEDEECEDTLGKCIPGANPLP